MVDAGSVQEKVTVAQSQRSNLTGVHGIYERTLGIFGNEGSV
jgi:hypothetical protein